MKLEKKTIYRVKTKELYNAMMKDAEKQGLNWWCGVKPTENDNCWDTYKENTCVRIDENGKLNFADEDYYNREFNTYSRKEYENTPEVFSCLGGMCVDAPDFTTAYKIFKEHIDRIGALPIQNNVYTIRVEDYNTTVITPDGKMATAKCHPDDEFDIIEGFRVALEKIKEIDRKLTQREKDILNAIIVLDGHSFYINEDHDLIVEFDDENIYVDIEKDDFKWCELFEDYEPKELLEKYA